MFDFKDNYKKTIEIFCIKVLQYKDKIDAGDESFFLEKDFKDDLKGDENIVLKHILSFKSIWRELSKANKEVVIQSMQILCELAQEYFDMVYNKK